MPNALKKSGHGLPDSSVPFLEIVYFTTERNDRIIDHRVFIDAWQFGVDYL